MKQPRLFSKPLLRSVHWTVHRLLPLAGYRLEIRRSGELKLGLWRKTLRKGEKGQKGAVRGSAASARRLVLIPGFGDTPLSWLGVMALLQPMLRSRFDELVLVDFPGFTGGLARERSFHSMDLLREKLFDSLDSLRPRMIVGHSLGGWLASAYVGLCGAGERPRIKHRSYSGPETLILADPSGVFGTESFRVEWEGRFRLVIEEGFHHLRPHVFGREPFWFKYLHEEIARFTQDEDIVAFMQSVRDEHWVEKLLPSIRSKVWLLWGEKDTLTPAELAPAWLEKLAPETDARVVLLKGVGHSPQLERPGLTAAVLSQMIGGAKGVLRHRAAGRWLTVVERA
ncbi:MAG: alpha/beta hydrolase [Oligoflexia bacterium]|nr:alpha/beta hydrolase [Oligoflexia bacterium]